MHCFTRPCNVLHDFQPEKKQKQKQKQKQNKTQVADNSWVLLVKKESALDFQHKIMATYNITWAKILWLSNEWNEGLLKLCIIIDALSFRIHK